MTPLRPFAASALRPRARTAWLAAGALAITATLAACAPSSDEAPTSAASEAADTTDGTTTDDGTSDSDAGGFTSDDVGNATLRVDGVEFPDFTGDCEISRENGKFDVGDLNDGDIVTIIGIDNVKAHEDEAMNYVALNEESFTFRDLTGAAGVSGPSAKGVITSLPELGPRTPDGSRDIVEVRFAGMLDAGTTLDANVVCELQNAF